MYVCKLSVYVSFYSKMRLVAYISWSIFRRNMSSIGVWKCRNSVLGRADHAGLN